MTSQTEQPDARVGEFSWNQWVLANALGFGVGAAVSAALQHAMMWPLVGTASESVAGVVRGIFSWAAAISGAVAIGAAQWFFLRQRVLWAKSWFLATSLGWLAGHFIAENVSIRPVTVPWSPVWSAEAGFVPAVLAALSQWLILRRHVTGAGWWVTASIAGAAVGIVGFLVGAFGAVVVAFFLVNFIDELWYTAVISGLLWSPLGATIGGITGVALNQLLNRPIRETLTPPSSTTRED